MQTSVSKLFEVLPVLTVGVKPACDLMYHCVKGLGELAYIAGNQFISGNMLAITVNVVTVSHVNAAFHKVTRAVAGSEPNVEACTGMAHQGCSFGKVIKPFIVTQYRSQGIV